jgi:hypothetical protein
MGQSKLRPALTFVLGIVLGLLALNPPRVLRARLSEGPSAPTLLSSAHDTIVPVDGHGPIVAWPNGTVPYYNDAPDQEWALRQAVAAWNGSGADVHFVAVPRDRAELVIEHGGGSSCGTANATVGLVRHASVHVFARDDASRTGCDPYTAAVALAHELGHVLGLERDEAQCSAMNPSANYRGHDRCEALPPWEWYCRLLEPVDVERVAAIYGGTPSGRGAAGCPLYRAISPPAHLALTAPVDAAQAVAISFSRPADPSIPPFLDPSRGEPAFETTLTRDDCPSQPEGTPYRWSDITRSVSYPPQPPGDYCVEVWALDALGRPSDTPATMLIHVD